MQEWREEAADHGIRARIAGRHHSGENQHRLALSDEKGRVEEIGLRARIEERAERRPNRHLLRCAPRRGDPQHDQRLIVVGDAEAGTG